MPLPRVVVKHEFNRFRGGLDQESPAMTINPGALLRTVNYVCRSEGGYERIDGYERFDGRTAPSAAVYYRATCTFTSGGPAVGNTITGVTSGSTGVVVTVGSNYINITKRSAAFSASETFNVSGSPKGTFTSSMSENGETTAYLHAVALNAAADVYRADIAKPAGTYAIRGLVMLAGVLYAFVDNSGGTTGEIYKSTAAGWVNVPLFSQISFNLGTAAISDGDTITQSVSGATALVKRVVLESGTWAAGTAAGRLIITTITGTFNATNLLNVGGAPKATASSLATAITITVGGRYEFVIYNFTGSTSTRRIYGCDGVNKGFEFDGTTFVPIHTGMTVDVPVHVSAFKSQLIFSFYGSSQNSAPGDPYSWTPVTGAAEIAVGENITGYSVEAETLLIISRNSTNQLFGEDSETFTMDPLDAEIGAIPWTIQSVGRTYCLDDRGIIQITRAQEYGNFALATISRRVQKFIDEIRSTIVASSVYRSKNQYRLYSNDTNGRGLCMTIGAGKEGLEYYFTEFRYPNIVSCVWTGEDATGKDVVFFGSTTGMVYQADKGSSFDGAEIEAFLWTPFNNSKSPDVLKTYRKATLEMSSVGYSEIRLNVEFSYGSTDIQSHLSKVVEAQGGGGYWDLADWDSFYYDSSVVQIPSLSLSGDGTNISVIIYSKSDIDLGHRIEGVTMQYTPRRLVR